MSILKLFKAKLAQAQSKEYIPKFKAGDIILNKKFKIVREVKEVQEIYKHKEHHIKCRFQYALIDLSNPLRKPSNLKFTIYKDPLAIDDYYDKIDDRTATILYGKK
jgi:hypothetical protein